MLPDHNSYAYASSPGVNGHVGTPSSSGLGSKCSEGLSSP